MGFATVDDVSHTNSSATFLERSISEVESADAALLPYPACKVKGNDRLHRNSQGNGVGIGIERGYMISNRLSPFWETAKSAQDFMRSRGAFVVASAIIVFLVAALSGCSPEQPGQNDGFANPTSGEEADEKTSEGEAATDLLLDLSDSSDRALLNEFLSWMSQAYGGEAEIPLAESDVVAQVRFAVTYLGITEPDAWESGDYPNIAGEGGGALGSWNERISDERISEVVRRFFVVEPALDSLPEDCGYVHQDGYVYFGVTAPAGQAAFWSAVKETEDLGGGVYRVDFVTFQEDMPYSEKDRDFFESDDQAMMNKLGVDEAWCEGEAKVRVLDREGEKSIALVSYEGEMVDHHAGDSDEDAGTDPTVIDTPYYHIEIPANWLGDDNPTYEVSEELEWQGEWGIGCHTMVHVGGGTFEVACFTDNWGIQGDYACRNVGTPGNLPGWQVQCGTPNPRDNEIVDLTGSLDEFVSFITLADAQSDSLTSEGGSTTEGEDSDSAADVAYSIDSSEAARSYLIDRLTAAGQFIPPEIDVLEYQGPHDSIPGGYSAHGYTNVRDSHTVTAFYWTVTEDGQVYDKTNGRYLDLETMQ